MRQSPGSDKDKTLQTASDITLSASQIRQLAETALQLENHFGGPQDIEWSFDRSGQLYILQSRPIPVNRKKYSPDISSITAQAETGEISGEYFFLLTGIGLLWRI